ncbi:hypothetical protein GCM10009544_16650 [Streptomyces stramineus]|uniref:Uncharacterized protein n=1 Tax=Streptomyces stramineus TaxID=173861 RepID=A0ABP3JM35_9ACTN
MNGSITDLSGGGGRVPMAWLCAHCLFDRKAKPRLADVLLRVFHHPSSGSTATPLNTTEAAVLLEALLTVPAPDNDEHDPGVSGQATALPKETAGTPSPARPADQGTVQPQGSGSRAPIPPCGRTALYQGMTVRRSRATPSASAPSLPCTARRQRFPGRPCPAQGPPRVREPRQHARADRTMVVLTGISCTPTTQTRITATQADATGKYGLHSA